MRHKCSCNSDSCPVEFNVLKEGSNKIQIVIIDLNKANVISAVLNMGQILSLAVEINKILKGENNEKS